MTTTATSRIEDIQEQRARDAHWFTVGVSDALAGRPEHSGRGWAPTYRQGYRHGRDELAATHPAAGACRADDVSETADDADVCVYIGCPADDLIVCPCGDIVCSDHANRDHIHECSDYAAWVRA